MHKQSHAPSLTESWLIPQWLTYYNLDYNTVDIDHATTDSWYPVGINFWDFEQNYLTAMDHRLLNLLAQGKIRVIFYYREADNPFCIREHIKKMCEPLNIDPKMILLISGNTHADSIDGARFFWHIDIDYFFRCQNSKIPAINNGPRTRHVTCLSRIKKNWREWFVFNLLRFSEKDYISYGNIDLSEFHPSDDFVLWNQNNLKLKNINQDLDLLAPDDAWLNSLPLKVDDLTSTQHNDHSIVIEKFFQDSYWNIVLETLLDADGTPGLLLSEKTLKPIRNGQSFIILGCQNSLEFLKQNGYKTFNSTIEENYDFINDIRERWYRVFELAKYLTTSNFQHLESLQKKNLAAIKHNMEHFQRSRRPDLESFLKILCN